MTGHCHCGRNGLEIAGPLPDQLTRCTCSFCKTRRIGVNARMIDDFEAADWPVTVIDGRHLW